MRKIKLLLVLFFAANLAISQTITDIEIRAGAAYLKQTNGKIFSIIKPVTAINVEFIYLTDTTITLWGNKTSPERTFLLSQLISFKVDGVSKPITSFSFKTEFALILNSVTSGGVPVGAATEATLTTVATNTTPIATTNVIQEIEVTTAVSGTILAGARFVSVANFGTANATFNGVTIYPNQTNTYPVILQKPYGAIAYTGAVGAILKIINIR